VDRRGGRGRQRRQGFKPGDRVVGECVVKLPDRIHHFGFSMDGAFREYFCSSGMDPQIARVDD
jgi:hypothetical protein